MLSAKLIFKLKEINRGHRRILSWNVFVTRGKNIPFLIRAPYQSIHRRQNYLEMYIINLHDISEFHDTF